jgi:hypothetical protein
MQGRIIALGHDLIGRLDDKVWLAKALQPAARTTPTVKGIDLGFIGSVTGWPVPTFITVCREKCYRIRI